MRSIAKNETFGLSVVEWQNATPDADKLSAFITFLDERIRKQTGFEKLLCSANINDLGGSGVHWQRKDVNVYPIYVEKLLLMDKVEANVNGLPLLIARPGEWHLGVSALDPKNFEAAAKAWDELIARRDELALGGGLSVNALTIDKASLANRSVDLRPLVLHALRRDGGATDRGRVKEQQGVANSFWQTYWATGALRSQRGQVFPIAFLPIDRAWSGEFLPPFKERWVNANKRYHGRTSLLAWVAEILTTEKALLFNREKCLFVVSKDFVPDNFGLEPGDLDITLSELNRTAFVDAYILKNAEVFAAWKAREERLGRGDGFDPENIRPAVFADAADDDVSVIRRVVPFGGAAYLSQVVHETARLIEDEKIQDLEGDIIAATNSTFFLNFPEEYCNIHSAMNDPVSVLIENGRTHQAKTLRRAAFVLTEDGTARISTTGNNVLLADALLYEAEFSSATAFCNAAKPGKDNTFGPLFFGAVIVGDSIVETFEDCKTELPNNGWAMGDSEAFGGTVEPAHAVKAIFRSDDGHSELDVRHAFAVGPLLVRDGKSVEFGHSNEEFMPVKLKEPMNGDETAMLPRATMPHAVRECEAKGVSPTRFPHDWNDTRAPRTALGIKDDGTVLLVVVDGRADLQHSVGVTLAELAQVMINLGCREAMNMDGGGSSVMFVNEPEAVEYKINPELCDGVVNLPSDGGGVERMLPVPLVITRRKK